MYWGVKYNQETAIIGPYESWQRACMAQYGCITIDMLVKWLGNDSNKIVLQNQSSKLEGYFVPYIPDYPLGLTMDSSKALGPKEISERMLEISNQMKVVANQKEARVLFESCGDLLRHLPLTAAAKFSEFYNALMLALPTE